MQDDATPAWERSKENAAPLERGRNVKTLEPTTASTQEEREEKERMVRHYERLVAPSERQHDDNNPHPDNDDDPLIHWLSYIKFHQDAFPSDTHAQFLLMERCTRALVHRSQYSNDVRFIRVCVTYADKTSFPADVFKYLHQHKVGTHTALFWVAWAWVAENQGDYAFAEKVFLKGLSKEAKPVHMLQQRHKQFQRRMSRHWLNTTQADEEEEEEEEEDQSRRGALGRLTEDAYQRNDRASSRHSSSRPSEETAPSRLHTFSVRGASSSAAPANNGAALKARTFEIFVEDQLPEDESTGYNLDQSLVHHEPRPLDREQDRKKENEATAERWNDRGGLGATSSSYAAQRPTASARPSSTPAFDVFVDEECAAKLQREKLLKKRELDAARVIRDERTLRQRTEEGVAEKLARDPMRYVRNPSELAADQEREAHASDDAAATARQGRHREESKRSDKAQSLHCGFSKRLVAKDSRGQEQCFEEGRAKLRSYKLVDSTQNFNLLAAVPLKTDDSTMDMDEDDTVSMENVEKERQRPLSTSSSSASRTMPRKALFHAADNSMDSQNHFLGVNTSTASSTVNERDAVGVADGKEEETINTKLAMKELSMMFSSPALGLTGAAEPVRRRPNDESQNEHGDGDTATFSMMAGLAGVDTPNANDNSILAASRQQDENDENLAARSNPFARSTATSGFESCALRPMEDDEVPTNRHVLEERARAIEESAGAGFQIYVDDDEEVDVTTEEAPLAPTEGTKAAELSFQIYQDDQEEAVGEPRDSGGDTATFSVLGEALGIDQKRDSGEDTATFSVLGEALAGAVIDEKRDSGGDTATFSVLGDALADVDSAGKPPSKKTETTGFSIYVDDDSIHSLKDFEKDRELLDAPEFGDISQIIADDGDVTAPVHHRPRSTLSPPTNHASSSGVDYARLHNNDIRASLRRMHSEARNMALNDSKVDRNPDLSIMLSTKGCVYDMPNLYLPRALQKKTTTQGSEITVGERTGFIKEELGRGAYGVVVLMEISDKAESDHDSCIAVKAQAPTDCLALEYTILEKIEDRVGPYFALDKQTESPFPYPRALSFVSLADGGLLGMTAGSKSGLNLVDISNVYKLVERSPVPELVVLHYTARMLMHLETLHWRGKILHCDVKPDNWVLMASATAFESCRNIIEAADLMLVDFGRALDLTEVAKADMDPMNVKLLGDAAGEDMSCVAMRKGLSWSFDVDTYGVCASAHVLLFGSHLEIEQDRTTHRWMPRKPLRRYWQKEIWTEVFDTLLNLDEVSGTALGSRSRSLRSLRNMIEEHLRERSRELESLLRHQARILPASRPGVAR